MSTALKSVFSVMKQTGLIKRIDTYLLTRNNEENADRKNITNSPSGALGCSRANFYQRQATPKDPINPRTQRIFDNGHGVHDRLQTYLEKMGLLLMREVPLIHSFDEIQGHTDGIMDLSGKGTDYKVLEIKSINGRGFTALKEPKEDHRAQGSVYLYCIEEHRVMLRNKYTTREDFINSEFYRRVVYAQRYLHLEDGKKYTRADKVRFKVKQHIELDNILFKLVKPINKLLFLYEDKDTQELKEYEIERDEVVLEETLRKYRDNNRYYAENKMPPRECKNKTEGKWCNYLSTCFE